MLRRALSAAFVTILVACGGANAPQSSRPESPQAQAMRPMAAATGPRAEVAQLYVALFGRAADLEGLNFWTAQLNSGRTLAEVAQAMFDTTPARDFYPTYLAKSDIVARFYRNVLRRTGETQGLNFWNSKLDVPGTTVGAVISEMLSVVSNYSGSDAQGIYSAALFNNRAAAALEYAERNLPANEALDFLVTISTNPASVAAAFDPSPLEWTESDAAWPQSTNVFFANGLFYMGGNNGKGANSAVTASGTYSTSDDGVNWTAHALPFTASDARTDIFAYRGGRFFAGASSKEVLTSLDGQSWTPLVLKFDFSIFQTAYVGGRHFLFCYRLTPNGSVDRIFYIDSADAMQWSAEQALPERYFPSPVSDNPAESGQPTVFAGTTPYFNGPEKSLVRGSPTYIAWDPASHWQQLPHDPLTGTYPNSVAYGNGVYVARAGGMSLESSTDLIHWTPAIGRYMGERNFAELRPPKFAHDRFFGGYGNRLLSSTNGSLWKLEKTTWTSATTFAKVAYGNGIYVMVSRYPSPASTVHIAVGRHKSIVQSSAVRSNVMSH